MEFLRLAPTREMAYFCSHISVDGCSNCQWKNPHGAKTGANRIPDFACGMLLEGFVSYQLEWQKHNSMYVLLIPVMFFLFEWLLASDGMEIDMARDLSMYIYILHPLCIVLVRGMAGALKMTKILVEQSLVHYLAVVAASVILSLIVVEVKLIYRRWSNV